MRCPYLIISRYLRKKCQLCMWSIRFIFITDMCTFCWKLFFRLDIVSTFRGVQTPIFTYVPSIVISLHEEPANFYREKRSVTFVTGHLSTFLLVLSLICLVTTQILVWENQTTWRLWILLKTIVAALLIKVLCEQTREFTHDFLDYV